MKRVQLAYRCFIRLIFGYRKRSRINSVSAVLVSSLLETSSNSRPYPIALCTSTYCYFFPLATMLSKGQNLLQISLVNFLQGLKTPTDFTYTVPSIRVSNSLLSSSRILRRLTSQQHSKAYAILPFSYLTRRLSLRSIRLIILSFSYIPPKREIY